VMRGALRFAATRSRRGAYADGALV
jgi:hypothetical protein